MGGIIDEVKGPTKLATWLAFQSVLRELRDDDDADAPDQSYVGGLYLIFPSNKKEAYRRMRRLRDDAGFVLVYHLHS